MLYITHTCGSFALIAYLLFIILHHKWLFSWFTQNSNLVKFSCGMSTILGRRLTSILWANKTVCLGCIWNSEVFFIRRVAVVCARYREFTIKITSSIKLTFGKVQKYSRFDKRFLFDIFIDRMLGVIFLLF